MLVVASVVVSSTLPPKPYAYMDDWEFYQTADACTMKTRDSLGTEVMVAKSPKSPAEVVIMVGNATWTSMKAGQKYDGNLYLSGLRVPSTKPVGVHGREKTWLAFSMRRVVAAEMFQQGGSLNFFYQNRLLTYRALDRFDRKAFDELSRCSGLPEDPFADSN